MGQDQVDRWEHHWRETEAFFAPHSWTQNERWHLKKLALEPFFAPGLEQIMALYMACEKLGVILVQAYGGEKIHMSYVNFLSSCCGEELRGEGQVITCWTCEKSLTLPSSLAVNDAGAWGSLGLERSLSWDQGPLQGAVEIMLSLKIDPLRAAVEAEAIVEDLRELHFHAMEIARMA